MRNKYNEKLSYRIHHELNNHFSNHRLWFFWIIVSALITGILAFFRYSYSHALKSFDFATSLIIVFYVIFIRPAIFKGKIKAYYRRRYKDLPALTGLYLRIAILSTGRILTASSFYYLIYKTGIEDAYLSKIFENLYHPIATQIAVVIPLLLFFIMFYQDKYVTVREYSNEINYRLKELNFGLRSAVEDFLATKDEEYGIKEFKGMYYDYEEQKEQEKNESKIEKEKKPEEDEALIRRSSRT